MSRACLCIGVPLIPASSSPVCCAMSPSHPPSCVSACSHLLSMPPMSGMMHLNKLTRAAGCIALSRMSTAESSISASLSLPLLLVLLPALDWKCVQTGWVCITPACPVLPQCTVPHAPECSLHTTRGQEEDIEYTCASLRNTPFLPSACYPLSPGLHVYAHCALCPIDPPHLLRICATLGMAQDCSLHSRG